ncbi:hypothetical protein C0991_004651 [Blastosporella zonata]|nr:hypothetical protein C0991_004651 [Blastosporella zonata]
MLKLSTSLIALALAISPVLAQQAIYAQCGGVNWTGGTTCVSGTTCQYQNDYYSQCLPGTATSTTAASTTTTKATTSTTSTTATSTTTKASTTSTSTTTTKASTTSTSTTTSSTAVSTGFVKTSGTRFTLNGSPYTVVGSNSYWVGLMSFSTTDMNTAFANIAATGATTVRTWGFNEETSANGDYYQLWSGSTATVNTGATGLQNFDNVIAAAKANGIRLIVALTNNWSDYGGMDVYVQQLLGSSDHDYFYTNATVIAAYQKYVNTFVSRYINEPTILAWELSNEPRCKGSTGTWTGTCTTATVTSWIKTMSAYIKSIDSNHLVAIGDEGFYNQPSASTYPYQGSEGIDFAVNLAISTIDFGTFHSYPEPWGQSANATLWGAQWIIDHAASQNATNKPVILEEFGVTASQTTTYPVWLNTILSSGLAGDLIWQAGSYLTNGATPNDGYAVYPDGPVYPLLTAHAAALKARG